MKKFIDVTRTFFLAIRCSFSFCWRNEKWLTIGRIITTTVGAVLTYLAVVSMGYVVNVTKAAIGAGNIDSFATFFGSDLGRGVMFLGAIAVAGVINSRMMWYFTNRWNHSLRFANQRELNEHRISLDIGRYRSKRYDDLTNQIEDIPGSWASRTLFADQLVSLLSSIVTCIAFGSALLTHSPFYFAVIFAVSCALIHGDFTIVNLWWHTYSLQTPFSKKRGLLQRAYHQEQAFIQAHMFNQAPALRKDIDKNVAHIMKMYEAVRRETLSKESFNYLFGIAALLLVAVHVMWSTAVGIMSLGTLTVLIASARQFQSGIENLVSQLADQWNSARGVILIEKDFMGLQSALKTEKPVDVKFQGIPRISLDRVCFAYPDQPTLVLKDISLDIEPGEKLAVVGQSGSGKTSLFALMARHYDPTSGVIRVNGIPLVQFDPSVWFRYISGLTQDYAILDRTIKEEIASSRLGEPIDDDRVREAARFACFESVVESDPKGYDAQIGTQFGGKDYSGGEKQRLALARAKYRGTPILILDEPDSRLDPETADRVMDNIFALKGVTVVIITHHVSRASRCDKIALMDGGQIVEFGTHADLMAQGGKYVSMFSKDKKRLAGS